MGLFLREEGQRGDGEGGRKERREGPIISVKLGPAKVSSTLLTLAVQSMKLEGPGLSSTSPEEEER